MIKGKAILVLLIKKIILKCRKINNKGIMKKSKKVIIYFDGGTYKEKIDNKVQFKASYGVLMHKGLEDPIESLGSHNVPLHCANRHEYVAFVEAYKLIKEHEIEYKDIHFYTDCDMLAFSNLYLHKDNYYVETKKKLLEEIKLTANVLGIGSAYHDIIECLEKSIFHKVKSHDNCIDNFRVDYLSKQAYKKNKPLCYQEFLGCAFKSYKNGSHVLKNLPFMPEFTKIKINIY